MSALMKQMLLDSPAGLWPLTETSGSTAYDMSGNARHGTYTGGVVHTGSFLGTPTASFDGATGYVTIPDNNDWSPSSSTNHWTLEIWAFIPATPTYPKAFIGKATTSGQYEWDFSIANWGGAYNTNTVNGTFTRFDASANDYGVVWPSGTATNLAGAWHQFVMVLSGSMASILGYIDGVQGGTAVTQGSSTANLASDVRIGTAYGGRWWSGPLAYAAIYTTNLSAARIKAHYQAGIRNGIMVG